MKLLTVRAQGLGFWTSLFLIGCWVLTVALLPRPFTPIDKWFYFLVSLFQHAHSASFE
jgi:hypothetical protein